MLALLVDARDRVVDAVLRPVDAVALEPFALDVLDELAVLALAPLHCRRQQGDGAPCVLRQQVFDDLLGRLLRDGDVVVGAVGHAGAREQQAQVVIDLRQRADGGPGVLAG